MTNILSSRGGLTRRSFGAGLACAATLGVPALRAQTSNRIVLGQSAAFTGAAAQLGIQFHAGAKLFFDQYNAQGPARRRGWGRRAAAVRSRWHRAGRAP